MATPHPRVSCSVLVVTTRRWTSEHVLRLIYLGAPVIGVLLTVGGIYGDAQGFWGERPFLTNLYSGSVAACFGVPLIIFGLERVKSASLELSERRKAIVALRAFQDTATYLTTSLNETQEIYGEALLDAFMDRQASTLASLNAQWLTLERRFFAVPSFWDDEETLRDLRDSLVALNREFPQKLSSLEFYSTLREGALAALKDLTLKARILEYFIEGNLDAIHEVFE
jgi:hypothetical protein